LYPIPGSSKRIDISFSFAGLTPAAFELRLVRNLRDNELVVNPYFDVVPFYFRVINRSLATFPVPTPLAVAEWDDFAA